MAREIAGRKETVKTNSVHYKNLCFYLHSDFRGHLGMVYVLMFSHIHALALTKCFFSPLYQEEGIHFIWAYMR